MTGIIAKTIRGLCVPSYIYFLLSMMILVVIAIQNYGNKHTYCVGLYQCHVSDTMAVFVGKLLYIVFWTWLLNTFCKAGYTSLSWFLVLLPIVLMFVMIGALLIAQSGSSTI
jgi:hypothetical protein